MELHIVVALEDGEGASGPIALDKAGQRVEQRGVALDDEPHAPARVLRAGAEVAAHGIALGGAEAFTLGERGHLPELENVAVENQLHGQVARLALILKLVDQTDQRGVLGEILQAVALVGVPGADVQVAQDDLGGGPWG